MFLVVAVCYYDNMYKVLSYIFLFCPKRKQKIVKKDFAVLCNLILNFSRVIDE